jgi:thiosulfate/3-mercaptopyruvate sulfurtransferase
MSTEYSVPDVLVTTDWVLANTDKPGVRIAEVDYDPSSAYDLGHIPGAVLIDWKRDINDPVKRDVLSVEAFEALMGRLGITPDTTVVLYGDFRNWFAAFAFWVFKLYGHRDVRLIDGGRRKWIDEGKPLTDQVPAVEPASYKARGEDLTIRAFLPTVLHALDHKDVALVDVRSPAEYKGEILAPPEYPNEGAQRGGHIPRAVNIPWAQAVRDDDTFKPADELRRLYQSHGITPDKTIITYCRIGERSSHTWFVLKYLLGYPVVLNYDGSWSEWGNAVGLPIER